MKDGFTILIADRNPHVRAFLFRELRAEGHRIHLARNSIEVIQFDYTRLPVDLLILDLGLPDVDQTALIKWLIDEKGPLHLIIHSFGSDYEMYASSLGSVVFVEKNKNSIEQLKKTVAAILKQENIRAAGIQDRQEDMPLETKLKSMA